MIYKIGKCWVAAAVRKLVGSISNIFLKYKVTFFSDELVPIEHVL